MNQAVVAPAGVAIEQEPWRTPVQCPHCNGRRGFKRQCGGGLSDWVWADCDECNGSGYAQMAAGATEAPQSIEITYEQLYTLVAGAKGYVAHKRREQRQNGISSWAVATDVDNIQRVANEVDALMKAVR